VTQTTPATQHPTPGYRAGHRNRRLGMGLPINPIDRTRLSPGKAFNDRDYGLAYFKGWWDADYQLRLGASTMLPCAAGRVVVR